MDRLGPDTPSARASLGFTGSNLGYFRTSSSSYQVSIIAVADSRFSDQDRLRLRRPGFERVTVMRGHWLNRRLRCSWSSARCPEVADGDLPSVERLVDID
jgi:hypothetical protein